MDTLVRLNSFANDVAYALNEKGVTRGEDEFAAVMVIVAPSDEDGEPCDYPVGASINFVDGKWEVHIEASDCQPVDG